MLTVAAPNAPAPPPDRRVHAWRGPVVLGLLLLFPTLAAIVYFASKVDSAGGKIAVAVTLLMGYAAFVATAVGTMTRGPRASAPEPGSEDDEPRVP